MDWGIILQVAAIIIAGIGSYVAVKEDLAKLHADLANIKEDVHSLEKDVRRHDRTLAGLDRRHHENTRTFPVHDG